MRTIISQPVVLPAPTESSLRDVHRSREACGDYWCAGLDQRRAGFAVPSLQWRAHRCDVQIIPQRRLVIQSWCSTKFFQSLRGRTVERPRLRLWAKFFPLVMAEARAKPRLLSRSATVPTRSLCGNQVCAQADEYWTDGDRLASGRPMTERSATILRVKPRAPCETAEIFCEHRAGRANEKNG